MEFKKAYEALKQGKDIKRPRWKGFWRKENGTIAMHCKDGRVIPITDTEDVFFTFDNIAADDWEIVDGGSITGLDISTFTFGEAISRLKRGQKVARKGWNGKGMYLWLLPESKIKKEWCRDEKLLECFGDRDELLCLGSIRMYTHDSTGRTAVLTGWLASQSDMLAEDWHVVE